VTSALVESLAEPDRLVAYAAMAALLHQSRDSWLLGLNNEQTFQRLLKSPPPTRLRALAAARLRKTPTSLEYFVPSLRRLTQSLLAEPITARKMRLDLLRVLGLLRDVLETDPDLGTRIRSYLAKGFPDPDRDIRWEQVRLAGEYQVVALFGKLLVLLETEADPVTQFHIAQALSKLKGSGSPADEERLVQWFLRQQNGWFAEFAGKGVEFPDFWLTVLSDFGAGHREILLRDLAKIDFAGQLGTVAIGLMANQPDGQEKVFQVYGAQAAFEPRLRILQALKQARTPVVAEFLRKEWQNAREDRMRGAIVESLAVQNPATSNLPILTEGLKHPDPQVVRICMEALTTFQTGPTESLANLLLGRMIEQRSLFRPAYKALAAMGQSGPLPMALVNDPSQRISDAQREQTTKFWRDWYAEQFKKPFTSAFNRGETEKSDEALHEFLLSEKARGGNAANGAKVYEALACNSCHGGGVTPGREGRLFGPDLAGITRRLSRVELADAIVYPSKLVPDRYKAVEIELKDATPLTGFITEQSTETVTLAGKEQVHRISRGEIRAITPQSSSLMPSSLLSRSNWEEVRDLIAFLDAGSADEPRAKESNR